MRNFSIIVAMDEKRGIGQSNALAWHLPSDLKHFKTLTTTVSGQGHQNAVIMGRKTWDSLPEKYRPLPGRLNVVISRQCNLNLPKGVKVFSSLQEALKGLEGNKSIGDVFVIGGAQLYADSILDPNCKRIHVTEIQGVFSCDVFFPMIPKIFQKIDATEVFFESGISYRFIVYTVNRKPCP